MSVRGFVVDIEYELARVAIGDDEDEWFFPMTMLPDGAQAGDDILLLQEDGSFSVLGFARVNGHSTERLIQERLSRPLNVRKAKRAWVE